jgi:hypothetical protein
MSLARDIADLGAVTARLDTVGASSGALSNRNIIINGAMQVAQRGTSSTGLGASAGYFTCDRWKMDFNATAGRLTMSQASDGPVGFANCIKLDCTTADTSIAAGEYIMLEQRFEGQDLQQIGKGTSSAKELTLSFYVKANAAFTFGVELFDNDNTRQITKLFTTTTGWNRIELTYPADTTGAFDDDNARSLLVTFWLHSGSTYAGGTLNSSSWASVTNANRAAGIDSFFSSTSNEFYITGVQLEVGSQATPFEHRSFSDELLRCKRYYESSNRNITGTASTDRLAYLNYTCYTTSSAYCTYFYEVEKRAIPTITHGSSDWRIYQNSAQISSGGAGGTDGIGHRNFSLTISGPTFDVSEAGMCDYRVHDGIKIDAEL